MHVSKEKLHSTKSLTSFYDLCNSAPYNRKKHGKTHHTTCGDRDQIKFELKDNSLDSNQFITSERYHLLNQDLSHKSIVRSTSTIFYDLDDVAKRHSFHCMNDVCSSNVNLLKIMKIPLDTNVFNAKTETIVQECATQIKPKLLPRDSIEINAKKVKRSFPEEVYFSSEIFLRDDNEDYENNKSCYDREITDRQQKFWSFAKYRTEYTNPIHEEKKRKKKDRGKRTEDPCPCQLFSYACPCTDKKSLTELAKNSKSLTVADQITSTCQFPGEERRDTKSHKGRKCKSPTIREDKLLSTDYVEEVIDKYEVISTKNEVVANVPIKHDAPTLTDAIQTENASIKSKTRSGRKHRKVTCPKCRENVDVILSTTDEEESMKYTNSSVYRLKDNSSKGGHRSPRSIRHRSVIAEDNCGHDPQCELIPVCQILPTDNVYNLSHKCIRKLSNQRTSPKVIRITKACRHHPPCTVVPSCQRANVLKNNCEYIPPCLHRPRCVNLPLCVPLKNLNYENLLKNADDDGMSCPHSPRCKCIPEGNYEATDSNLNQHVNIVSQVQNTCEFLAEYPQKQYGISPKTTTCGQSTAAVIGGMPRSCHCCKSNKSCQFDCPDCKCAGNNVEETDNNDAVIFIRDVGCQFRNKRFSNKNSDPSKLSSASFDLVDVKMGNYYTNVHTLRYEDKFTNAMVDEDFSETSISIMSLEIDSHCPTHGGKSPRKHSERTTTGFVPQQNTSPFVVYTTHRSQVMPSQMYSGDNELNDARTPGQGYALGTFPVKSHRSVLRGKYKKMFNVKRRRKSKASSHGYSNHSRKLISVQNLN